MKKLTILFLAGLMACSVPATPEGPEQQDFWNSETEEQKNERMAWWREARFGMFIHWGLYAIPAGEWNGETKHAEWIRSTAQIPLKQYDEFVDRFNPVKFNAEEWVLAAKNAGMKYVTITTKHHDGFSLFDSKQTDFDIMSTPFRRDIMKELSEACRKHGLEICWYHSIMDWHHPDYLPRRHWEKDRPTEGADFDRYRKYLHAQCEELLTNYGKIGVMWFDGEWQKTWQHEHGVALYDHCRRLQPSVIVNNRVDTGRQGMAGLTKEGEFRGDYGTPEQEVPHTGLDGIDWESCITMNYHWGWNKNDKGWKSSAFLIRQLIDIASKGGNYLLNVGPKADGTFPQESIDRLRDIGAWMKVNGEAIYGTKASPFRRLPWHGRCTRKETKTGTTLYLHVFDRPEAGKLELPGLKNEVVSARLLADSKTAVTIEKADKAVLLSLPQTLPDEMATVIAVDIKGTPEVEIILPSQKADGSILLSAMEATVHGKKLRFESGAERGCLGFWEDPKEWAEWTFRITKPGTFTAVAEVAGLEDVSLTVNCDGDKLKGKAPATGNYGKFMKIDLGTLTIDKKGTKTLSIKAVPKGWKPVNLRGILLKPKTD